MEQWYVNQRVVCVKTQQWCGLTHSVKGATYTIQAIKLCACGLLKLDIGTASAFGGSQCDCGEVNHGPWWTGPSRFRPIDTLTATMDRLESEGAPVEVEISEPVLNRSENCSIT